MERKVPQIIGGFKLTLLLSNRLFIPHCERFVFTAIKGQFFLKKC